MTTYSGSAGSGQLDAPKDDGGQAFPSQQFSHYGADERGSPTAIYEPTPGMSLRDYLAGQCMRDTFAALAAAGWGNLNDHQLERCAKASYAAADAMIAERRK